MAINKSAVLLWVFAATLISGCASYGPNKLPQDQFDYNNSISLSIKEQALMNIVKFRYYDWPVFLDIDQIVTAYTWEHSGSAKATIRTPFSGSEDQGELGYSGKYAERPTIVYKPLRGQDFVRKIMKPIPPAALFSLVHSGWPADLMFRVSVDSINGVSNSSTVSDTGQSEAANFLKMIQLFRKLQIQNALVMDLRQDGGKSVAVLGFRDTLIDDTTRAEVKELKQTLRLDPNLNRYDVKWDVISRNPSVLAIQTRSIIQIMGVMARDIDVPDAHVASGSTYKALHEGDRDPTGLFPLLRTFTGKDEPKSAFVKINYRDNWYWVNDNDIKSKRVFLLLMFMLNVASPDDSGGAPLVITTN